MARRRDALTELRTAFNCPAKWSEMKGDDRVRHCSQCQLSVYNISAMSREEAVDFLEEHGEKICVRFYQRADGTILTRPCGAIKKFVYRFKVATGMAFSALGLMAFTPIFMPVMGGGKMSPGGMVGMYIRKVQRLNAYLKEETDPEARAMLIKQRDEAKELLMKAYERLTPEEIDKLGSLRRPPYPGD
jgi:hypothetical protein